MSRTWRRPRHRGRRPTTRKANKHMSEFWKWAGKHPVGVVWTFAFIWAFLGNGLDGVRIVLGVILTIEFAWLVIFILYRLHMVKKEGTPKPKPWSLVGSHFKVRARKHKIRQRWPTIGRVHQGMHSDLFKLVPKVWGLKSDVNDDIVGRYHPGVFGLSIMAVEGKTLEIAGSLDCVGGVETERFPDNGVGRCFIKFHYCNPLRRVIGLDELQLDHDDPVSIPFTMRRDGSWKPFRLDTNQIIAGLPGMGKSNDVSARINAILAAGHWVQLYVGDNKDGMELTHAEDGAGVLELDDRKRPRWKDGIEPEWKGRLRIAAYTMDVDSEDTEKLLIPKAVEDMKIRRAWMRKRRMRKLTTSSRENPVCIVIIDETLSLKKSTFEAGGDMKKLMSGGRACLFSVWLCTQDARVDAVTSGVRSLVGGRWCYPVDTPESVNAALGGSVANLAPAHQLDQELDRGVCYSKKRAMNGYEPTKTPFVTDEELEQIFSGVPVMPKAEQVVVTRSVEQPWLVYVRHDYSDDFRRVFRSNVSYVGQTSRTFEERAAEHRLKDWKWCDLHNRMENHWQIHGSDATTDIIHCKSKEAMDRLEEKLVRRYRPPFNDKLKPKGKSLRQLLLWDAKPAPVEPDDGLGIFEPEPEKVSVAYDPEIDGIEGAE